MRKLFGRRWVTIGFLAAGLAGLTATSASAAVEYNTPPPYGSTIVAPGCPNTDFTFTTANSTNPYWIPEYSYYSYAGPNIYGGDPVASNCTGESWYALDQATPTAWFDWWIYHDVPWTSDCQIYAYIPIKDAGDLDARYDFWASNGINFQWLAWPGATVDQEDNLGWTHIGGAIFPANTGYLVVSLNNGDPANPGWYTGVGAMAFYCTRVPGT